MQKEELLNALHEMINTEETAIPLYARYMVDSIFLSPFKDQTKKKIAEALTKMHEESVAHEKTLKILIKRIERSRQDVY